jgi:pimeloyl-ACP methyl ester carboxylesterase
MGEGPAVQGEDFLRDADDIADLMGNGAHLVGHSYGGLGVLFARCPPSRCALSLTLLEPGAFTLGQQHQAARALVADVRRLSLKGSAGLGPWSKVPGMRSNSPDDLSTRYC